MNPCSVALDSHLTRLTAILCMLFCLSKAEEKHAPKTHAQKGKEYMEGRRVHIKSQLGIVSKVTSTKKGDWRGGFEEHQQYAGVDNHQRERRLRTIPFSRILFRILNQPENYTSRGPSADY